VHPAQLGPGSLRAALQHELAAVRSGAPVARLRRQDGLAQVSQALLELMQVAPSRVRTLPGLAARASHDAGARHPASRSASA
jgi:hypothetical protein